MLFVGDERRLVTCVPVSSPEVCALARKRLVFALNQHGQDDGKRIGSVCVCRMVSLSFRRPV